MDQKKVDNFIYKDLSYDVRGCFFDVHSELGAGHKESVYCNALEKEFKKNNLDFESEKQLDVFYDGEKVGSYRPDFVVEDKVIVEVKAVEKIVERFERQLSDYLKGTGYKLGFLVNFGAQSVDIRRRVNLN